MQSDDEQVDLNRLINADDPALHALAGAILDGTPVDWKTAASGPAASYVDELRVLEGFVAVHRTLSIPDPTAAGAAADPARTATTSAAIGHWGPLTLLERIGEGAFGEVFRAWDPRLDREVALKLLRGSDQPSEHETPTAIEEGRLLARVRHPNVVTVYGAERLDGRVGIWTEFIHGRTLADWILEHGRFSAQEAITIGIDLCRALSAVHHAGLLHRDVKPQNIMREQGGRIVLMDFGAGKDRLLETLGGTRELTGTPLYLAPELLQGAVATAQSDLYSVGVVLYHLVTGAYPVRGSTLADLREAHAAGRRRLLRDERPDLPDAFIQIVERGIASRPADRYESAGALEAALRGVLHAPKRLTHRSIMWILAPRFARQRRLIAVYISPIALVSVAAVVWRLASPPAIPPTFRALDQVLIGAFENRTGDVQLDGAVEAVLAHELANSQFVGVADRQRIVDALELMGRKPDAVLTPDVAREVCLRDGVIRAFVAGRVQRVSTTYTLGAQVIEPRNGSVLASVMAEATEAAGLGRAIRKLSVEVREKLGETREALQASEDQFVRVTTPSIKAVRLYTDAYNLGTFQSNWKTSAQLTREAIAADPGFASAYNWLGWSLLNSGGPNRGEALGHFKRAVELSDGTTERERLFIRSSYSAAIGQREKAAAELGTLLRLFPDDLWAGRNFDILSARAETKQFWIRLAESWPNSLRANLRVAQLTFYERDDPGRTREAADRARRLAPTNSQERAWLDLVPAFLAWEAADAPRAVDELQRAAADRARLPDRSETFFTRLAGQMELALGRVRAAETLFKDLPDAWIRHSHLALAALARGDAPAARMLLEGQTPPGGGLSTYAWILARSGAPDEAERTVGAYFSAAPGSVYTIPSQLQTAQITAELARGRLSNAARLAREVLVTTPPDRFTSGPVQLRLMDAIADALIRVGDDRRAAQLLEVAARDKRQTFGSENINGYYWLRTQALLTQAYRHLGRQTEADALEQSLRSVLARADPDFQLPGGIRGGTLSPQPLVRKQ